MPCNSGMGDADAWATLEAQAAVRRADELAQILCELMQTLETQGSLGYLPKRAGDWYAKHKAEDLARRKAEAEAAQKEVERKAAFDKLTPYERKLLGLK